MEKILKVQAMPRTKDIISSNSKPAKGNDMVSWWQSFGRSGIRFSTEKPTIVTVVEGNPFPKDGEVNEEGAIAIISEPRLKVWDSEYVRYLMGKAEEAHRKEEARHQKRMPFLHAVIADDGGIPVADDSIEGQGVVFEDGYEDMNKATLKDALLNAGYEEKVASELFKAGKAAMISALRGH